MRGILPAATLAISLVFASINLSVPVTSFGYGRPDFVAFYGAWRMTIEGNGKLLYDPLAQKANQPITGSNFLPYPYPPHVTTPFAPFGLLSYKASFAVWLGIQYAVLALLLLRFWRAANSWFGIERLVFLSTLSAAPFVFMSLVNGAFSIVVALALFNWWKSKSQTAKGGWLALASLKPHFVVLPIVAEVTRHCCRSLTVFIIIIFALVILALPFYGWHAWIDYLRLLGISEAGGAQYTIAPDLMPTVKSLIVYGGATPAVAVIASGAALFAGTVAVFFIWKSTRPGGVKAALTITLALFLLPHANPYDAVILAVPAFLVYDVLRHTSAGSIFAHCMVIVILFYNLTMYSELWNMARRMPLVICCAMVVWSLYAFMRGARVANRPLDGSTAARR